MIHLMLVDDDKLAAMIAEKMFERVTGKFEISVHLDSVTALSVLKSKQNLPDAILLDINMPQIDGWSFLEQLNKMDIYMDVIMLTASVYEDDMQKAKEYPQVKGFFQKPLNKDKIFKLLKYYTRP